MPVPGGSIPYVHMPLLYKDRRTCALRQITTDNQSHSPLPKTASPGVPCDTQRDCILHVCVPIQYHKKLQPCLARSRRRCLSLLHHVGSSTACHAGRFDPFANHHHDYYPSWFLSLKTPPVNSHPKLRHFRLDVESATVERQLPYRLSPHLQCFLFSPIFSFFFFLCVCSCLFPCFFFPPYLPRALLLPSRL